MTKRISTLDEQALIAADLGRTTVMPDGEILPDLTVPKTGIFFKTPYNHDRDIESARTGLYCNDQSLTKQEFAEEVDINVIINRYLKTGEPPPMPVPEHFMDTSTKPTYFEMQQRIAEANANFYKLPPDLRAQHQNNPEIWADQVVKALAKKDGDTLLELGIDLQARPTEKAVQTPTPPAGTPAAGPESGASDAPKKAPSGAKD